MILGGFLMSDLAKKVLKYLKEKYPNFTILSEYRVGKTRYHIDFYIREMNMGVEVDGEQHSKFVPYFYKTGTEYARSRERDRYKEEWCEENNINLVRVKTKEDLKKL